MSWHQTAAQRRSVAPREGNTAISQLCEDVKCLANTAVHGGSCSVVSDTQALLCDCASWSNTMTQYLQRKYPTVGIHVASNISSVSGFVVHFTLEEALPRMANTMIIVYVVLLFIVMSWYFTLSVYHSLERGIIGAVPEWMAWVRPLLHMLA